ncbi:MAG: hypothetical protein M3O31_14420 [Acidobacteriota bacterium]|nr:hypothetical protein [Acidobacteriota bacterium]
MSDVTLSAKIGIAGIFVFMGSLLSTPYSGAFGIASGALGVVAAILGSKWWLAVPGTIIGITATMFFVLRHAH